MIKKRLILSIVIMATALFWSFCGNAQPSKTQAASPLKENPYKKWWYYPATVQDPIPQDWLCRVEGLYAYGDTDGNTEQYSHRGKIDLILRKKRLTSKTGYAVLKSRIYELATQSTTSNDIQNFSQMMTYDLFKYLSIEAGGMWAKDSSIMIGDRRTVFCGFAVPLYLEPRHILTVGAYYGGEQTRYMNADLATYFGMRQPDYNSDALFLSQKFKWLISNRVLVNQAFGYLHYFDDRHEFSQYGERHWIETGFYRWTLDISVDVQIVENVSLNTTYALKYEKNPLIESFPREVVKNKDSSITTGIKVAF